MKKLIHQEFDTATDLEDYINNGYFEPEEILSISYDSHYEQFILFFWREENDN